MSLESARSQPELIVCESPQEQEQHVSPSRSTRTLRPTLSQPDIGSLPSLSSDLLPGQPRTRAHDDNPPSARSPSRPPTRVPLNRLYSAPSQHDTPRRRHPSQPPDTSSSPTIHHTNKPNNHEREWTLFGQILNEGSILSTRRQRNARLGHLPFPPPETDQATGGTIQSHSTSNQDSDPFISQNRVLSPQSPTPLSTEPETIPFNRDYRSDDGDSDHSSESADESDDGDSDSAMRRTPSASSSTFSLPTLTRLQKNILKCSLAYLISSLFTFVPYLSGFLADVPSRGKWEGGPSPSGHMVATVMVYFNPAKTIGAMIEADIYVIFGLAFTAFVSLCSMNMFWFWEIRPGWEWLANIWVLTWLAGAVILIAWLKVWMARPSFNTACSMMCIIIFVVIVKEGNMDTLFQVAFTIVVGATISNIVCLCLWPESALSNLQRDMTSALASFATLLETLTKTFLLDPDFHPKQSKLLRAVEAHQKSFTSLRRNLSEAHSEWLPSRAGTTKGQAYDDAVGSLNRLAQHLAGLRSGTQLQTELTKAHREGKLVLQANKNGRLVPSSSARDSFLGRDNRLDGGGGGGHDGGKAKISKISEEEEEEVAVLAAAAAMFGDLVDDLGPPMEALAKACITTLRSLQGALRERGGTSDDINMNEFFELSQDIERALFVFDCTSNQALMRLYRRGDKTDRLTQTEHSVPPVVLGNGDNETVLLVYFFICTMQEFARELLVLVTAVGHIHALEQQDLNIWRRLWKRIQESVHCFRSSRSTCPAESKDPKRTLRKKLSNLVPSNSRNIPAFPKVRPHAPNTIQTPRRESLDFMGRLKQSLWTFLARVWEPDIKYAIKTGLAAAILASPAFFESTRPLFVEYRGEWALLSFFVVMSPVIGQTNVLATHRVLGTILGAVTAVFTYSLFEEYPAVLAFAGFLYSIPCFYYLISLPKYATTLRLILLAYNLTCLYSYNLRYEDPSVVIIGFRRAISVIVGVAWAFLVSHFWWPTEARRELGKALSEFCFNIGWLYSRMVKHYSAPPPPLAQVQSMTPRRQVSETTSLLGSGQGTPPMNYMTLPPIASNALRSSIHEFMAMELHLQRKLIALQELLAQTPHEPRLKGPFPVKLYRSILTSLQTILDKLHTMRCVTTREEWYTAVRRDFVIPVKKERRELVGNVILYFSVLASAFRLKAPLPPYLPPAEKSRQELVNAIRNLDVVKTRNVKGSRHLLYFAYALMMKGVIKELDFLGKTLQEAFGVLGGSTQEFENLFGLDGIRMEEEGA